MFGEIRDLLKERGRMSLRELALHFSMSADAIEPMLDLLVRKNKIRQIDFSCESGKTCAGCSCASRVDMMQYEIADQL